MIYPESPRLPHGRGAASRRAHALRGLPRLAPLHQIAPQGGGDRQHKGGRPLRPARRNRSTAEGAALCYLKKAKVWTRLPVNHISKVDLDFQKPHVVVVHCGKKECSFNLANPFYAGALAHVIEEILRAEERRSSLAEQVSPSGRISGTPSKAVAGAVKETSQGTFAKGVDTKWPETQTVAKGVTSLLPRKSDEIFNFKPPPRRQETVSVPPRG